MCQPMKRVPPRINARIEKILVQLPLSAISLLAMKWKILSWLLVLLAAVLMLDSCALNEADVAPAEGELSRTPGLSY
jgi:hypothetical protein